ncbi:TPA: hypothetical protein ACH3X1_012202 [Trebouxia sp. C0004]
MCCVAGRHHLTDSAVGVPSISLFMRLKQLCPAGMAHTRMSKLPVSSASFTASAQPVKLQGSIHELFSHRPVMTLERSVGKFSGADTELWQSGHFGAGIVPDLPVVSSWKEFGAKLLGRQIAAPQVLNTQQKIVVSEPASQRRQWQVQTLAAQTYSQKQMRQRIIEACICPPGSMQQPADALLLLSGSHPLRQMPLSDRWFTDSIQTLKMASELRHAGDVPPHVALWAVENPLTNSTDRLKRKIDAGAEVIVTQPPLLWDKFEAWISSVQKQMLLGNTRLIVGCPMVSSAANMKFWLYLCQLYHQPEAAAAVQPFTDAAAESKQCLALYCQKYNTDLVHKVLQFSDVAGIHVMPLTKQARQQTMPLMQSLSW